MSRYQNGAYKLGPKNRSGQRGYSPSMQNVQATDRRYRFQVLTKA